MEDHLEVSQIHFTLESGEQSPPDPKPKVHRKLTRAVPSYNRSHFIIDERLNNSCDENRNTATSEDDQKHEHDKLGEHLTTEGEVVVLPRQGEIIVPIINIDSGVSVSSNANDEVITDNGDLTFNNYNPRSTAPRMSIDEPAPKRSTSKAPNKNSWARRSCSLPDILDVDNITADYSDVADIFASEQSISSVLSDGKFSRQGGSLVNVQPLCGSIHSEEPSYICFKDREIYCATCVEVHNLHCQEKVKYIPEIPPELRQSFCQEALSEMTGMKERFERVKTDNDNNIVNLQELRKKYVRAVMKLKNSILQVIEHIEREALLEMDEVFQEEKNRIDENLRVIEDELKVINDFLEEFQSNAQTEGNALLPDLLTASRQIQSKEDTLHELHKESNKVKFEFKTSEEVDKLIKDIEGIWRFEKNEEACCRFPAPCVCDKPYAHRTAVLEKEFSARLIGWSFDREKCYITSCAFMPNGKLLLCDNNNKKIKLFNRKYKCISVQGLNAMPWDIAVINESLVVVTMPDKKLLQFLGIHHKRLNQKHSALLTENCWGVSHWNDNLYVSCWSPTVAEILVVDLQGTPKRHINCVSDTPLHTPWYVVAHDDVIHVSDWGTFSIPTLTQSGKLVHKYRSRHLLGPLGMASDPAGNIYVCARDSNNIHQLSSDGNVQRIVLSEKDGVNQPLSASHCLADDRFAVTSWMSDKIHIYKLQ